MARWWRQPRADDGVAGVRMLGVDQHEPMHAVRTERVENEEHLEQVRCRPPKRLAASSREASLGSCCSTRALGPRVGCDGESESGGCDCVQRERGLVTTPLSQSSRFRNLT